ncbi:MAG: zf-HC2 domain-containing protein [Bryobacteraceae bacterium]
MDPERPNSISCAEAEALLADELDGVLSAAGQAQLEFHRAGCPECVTLAQDAGAAVGFLGEAERVEPPPALVNRILFHTAEQMRLAGGPPMAPMQAASPRSWWRMLFEPILRPRLAMGMAMTLLSFSMIGRLAGVPQRALTADDLQPARVWATIDTRLHRVWDRAVKHYENLRLVYEVQDRLREWSEQDEKDARERRRAQPVLPDQVEPSQQKQLPIQGNSGRGDQP